MDWRRAYHKWDKPKFIRRKFPTLEQMHRDWEIDCVPPDVPRFQAIEMKKAFMSGVASLFHVMKFEIPEVSDEEEMGYLDRLDAEFVTFFTKDIFKL